MCNTLLFKPYVNYSPLQYVHIHSNFYRDLKHLFDNGRILRAKSLTFLLFIVVVLSLKKPLPASLGDNWNLKFRQNASFAAADEAIRTSEAINATCVMKLMLLVKKLNKNGPFIVADLFFAVKLTSWEMTPW